MDVLMKEVYEMSAIRSIGLAALLTLAAVLASACAPSIPSDIEEAIRQEFGDVRIVQAKEVDLIGLGDVSTGWCVAWEVEDEDTEVWIVTVIYEQQRGKWVQRKGDARQGFRPKDSMTGRPCNFK